MRYLTKNELVFVNEEDALKAASLILKNDYCVLLSKEEDLTILNYEFSMNSDRNDVIFRSIEEWEWEEMEKQKELEEIERQKEFENEEHEE